MTENKIALDEMVESLTYFDEMAIEQAFGHDWTWLFENKQTTLLRALCFVQKRREGMNDPEAKQAAFAMSLKDVQSAFVMAEEEANKDEPDTEQGKEGSPLA